MKDDLDSLKFNPDGLIPAIVQDHLTGEVRMMAWMNREALEATLQTRRATFWSRSRGQLWVKGEESKNVLHVQGVRTDCDRDTILVLCDPAGPSCHTERDNCFFVPLSLDEGILEPDPQGVKPMVERLEQVLESRKSSEGDKSYTKSLFEAGTTQINRKIIEEADELAQALEKESDERAISETADLLFHVLVGLRYRNISWRSVLEVLAGRFGVGGHVEKATRR